LPEKRFSKQPGTLHKPTSSVRSADSTEDRDSQTKNRKAGKLVAVEVGISSAHPNCPAKCEGVYRDGMWTHEVGCPYTVMLWFAHGFTASDWSCPYGCTPTHLSSGLTHHWQCTFWAQEGKKKTPFDGRPPKGTANSGRVSRHSAYSKDCSQKTITCEAYSERCDPTLVYTVLSSRRHTVRTGWNTQRPCQERRIGRVVSTASRSQTHNS
jgi:hypothetical protein